MRELHGKIAGRLQTQGPGEDEFASMLETLFQGAGEAPMECQAFTEKLFTMEELDKAIAQMKSNRAPDEHGLVAELLKSSPVQFREALLNMFNKVLTFGIPPESWSRTLFLMLPKSAKAKLVADYRPIASVRLLYKCFAYLILGRIEHTLEEEQPEEQHAFRGDRRLEEHLLTADIFIEKTRARNIPVWVVSLDLSKAFDRIAWPTLWKALLEHGVSQHLVWLMQNLYYRQSGQVKGKDSNSRTFDILAGVRQGCVLSPRLFCSVLEWSMAKWRRRVGAAGFDLGDGLRCLLDLRFADDIVFFATSYAEAAYLLDELVAAFAEVGLILNSSKTVALTTEAQPRDFLETPHGHKIKRVAFHKWLGCILDVGDREQVLEYHMAAATRAFYANRSVLKCCHASQSQRLEYFDKVVTPVACFASGRRTIYQEDMAKIDVLHRKLLRQVVGPPRDTVWTRPWHEILHDWHDKIAHTIARDGFCTWSQTCLTQYWKLGGYVANLPADRWLKRVLRWEPKGLRPQGRPRDRWDGKLRGFCNQHGVGDWQQAAQDQQAWTAMLEDFLAFVRSSS